MRVSGQFYFLNTHWKHKNVHKRTKTKKAVLNAFKNHLRGKKSLVPLFAFLCFLCAFCAFLCVNQRRQHFYAHKKHLRRRKSLVWHRTFYAFYPLYPHKNHLSESRMFALCAFCAFCPFRAFCDFCACEIFSFKK